MKTTNQYADSMINKIMQCVDGANKKSSKIIGAVVKSVNANNTVNVYIPPNNEKIFTNISNQSPFELHEGDSVELLVKNGSLSNCWVMAKHEATFDNKEYIKQIVTEILQEYNLI